MMTKTTSQSAERSISIMGFHAIRQSVKAVLFVGPVVFVTCAAVLEDVGTKQGAGERDLEQPEEKNSFSVTRDKNGEISLVELTGNQAVLEFLSRLSEFKTVSTISISGADLAKIKLAPLKDCRKLTDLGIRRSTLADDTLAWVPEVKQLEQLYLAGSKNVNPNLKYIAKCKALLNLGLESSDVSDLELQQVRKLKRLLNLNLSMTYVTPDAVEKVVPSLTKHSTLYLEGVKHDTQFTVERVQKWRGMVPGLYIYCDGK